MRGIFKKEDLVSGKIPISRALKPLMSDKDIRRKISTLRALDLNRADVDFIRSQLMYISHGIKLKITSINVGEYIYRAVKWDDRMPLKLSELSYPPLDKVKDYGRVNLPNKPMFYGSAGFESTYSEVDGDRLAISKWVVKKNINVLPMGYDKKKFYESSCNRINQINWSTHEQIAQQVNESNKDTLNYLHNQFTKNVRTPNEYKVSAIFADMILNATKLDERNFIGGSGILYPSVPNELNADNIALQPDIVSSCLQCLNVQYVQRVKSTDGASELQGLFYSDTFTEDGRIVWSNEFPNQLVAGTDNRILIDSDGIHIINNKGVRLGTMS